MFESVRELGAAFSFVCQASYKQREWLSVASGLERPGVDWIEAGIADQPGGDFLCAGIVAAIDQTGFGFAARLEDAEQDLARHGIERADDASLANLPRKLLCARGFQPDDEVGVVIVHWQRTADDHLVRQIPGLFHHIVDP